MAHAMKVWPMTVLAAPGSSSSSAAGGCRISILALGVALSFVSPGGAWAQMPGIGGGSNPGAGRPSQTPPPEREAPALPPPEAVPGAKARTPAAPATHAATDLQPTDALFDAINRGDIGAARDALNRGADMDGVNILGMTPMELSVDLGRNDISFLLLSMRGEDSGRGARAAGHDVAGTGPAAKTAASAKTATAAKPSVRTKAAMAPAAVASKPVAKPKLFANDGGTPLPSAGFLGFDPRLATN
jgi:hypothetical protein